MIAVVSRPSALIHQTLVRLPMTFLLFETSMMMTNNGSSMMLLSELGLTR